MSLCPTFQTTVASIPTHVQHCLETYLANAQEEFAHINPLVTDAITVLQDFVLNGGKRVRPAFVWAGIRAGIESHEEGSEAQIANLIAEGNTPASFLHVAAALELIQACALIHDDIIDASDSRRGNPTAHRTFETAHRTQHWLGSAEHYGISQAILLGDLALSWADDMFFQSGCAPEALQRSIAPWRAMRTEVIAGQMLDITVEANGSEFVSDAMDVITYKTASYTVARPLHLGAALAGASPAMQRKLQDIGHDIGTAFQLRDDQLGVFGDPAVTGKPSGDDLRSGKRTALINFALEQANSAQERHMRELLGNIPTGPAGEEAIGLLRTIIVDTGAAARVDNLIQNHSDHAVTQIRASAFSPSLRDELIGYTEALTHRTF